MVDRNGKEVKDIVLYMNTNIETYYCHVSEQVRSYTVEPPLPSRFTLDNNGVLTSYPKFSSRENRIHVGGNTC